MGKGGCRADIMGSPMMDGGSGYNSFSSLISTCGKTLRSS